MPSQVVKVAYSPEDLSQLDRDAQAAGISRAELIRTRTLTRSAGTKPFTTADYHKLVSDACAFTRGALSRSQVETLIAFTTTRLLGP